MPKPAVIAAFDVGSNSVKMTVARQLPDKSIEEFLWRAETTRLAEGIDTTGRISGERADDTLDALERFALDALRAGAGKMIGVATEAIRIAENGSDVLAKIREDTGIEIEAITGDQEAALTFDGLDPSIDRSGSVLVADIGGGSSELIMARDGEIVKAESLPIGSGRLTDRFVPHDPPKREELEAVRASVCDQISVGAGEQAVDRLVVVGGTAEYLRRILNRDWPVGQAEIGQALDVTLQHPAAELAQQVEAQVARARVLPAGIAEVIALADVFCPAEILGATSGIRLGLIKSAFAEASGS